MKVIIAGTRTIEVDRAYKIFHQWWKRQKYIPDMTEVVTGACITGPDQLAYILAARGLPIKEFPADWDACGKKAGPMRNAQMAEYADALILIWDGYSAGSSNMRQEMLKRHKPVFELITHASLPIFQAVEISTVDDMVEL